MTTSPGVIKWRFDIFENFACNWSPGSFLAVARHDNLSQYYLEIITFILPQFRPKQRRNNKSGDPPYLVSDLCEVILFFVFSNVDMWMEIFMSLSSDKGILMLTLIDIYWRLEILKSLRRGGHTIDNVLKQWQPRKIFIDIDRQHLPSSLSANKTYFWCPK